MLANKTMSYDCLLTLILMSFNSRSCSVAVAQALKAASALITGVSGIIIDPQMLLREVTTEEAQEEVANG